MEERLELDIVWAINPFVHNPYHKHKHSYGSGSSTPGIPSTPSTAHDPDSQHGPSMITVQQMKVGTDRRASVQAHGAGPNQLEQLAAPRASYAELFYDLFFVASLTSFGIKHEITQAQAIASYVAFFTVLW